MSAMTIHSAVGNAAQPPFGGRVLATAMLAFVSALAQAATLTICAVVGAGHGMVTVLHRTSTTYDIAAWHFPMRGGWGVAITLAEVLTILASLVMAVSRDNLKRRVGLVLMASWGGFWAYRFGTVTWFTRDAIDAGLTGLATLALASQVVLCVKWWGRGPSRRVQAV